MRRASLATAIFVSLVAGGLVAPPARASAFVVELGVRAGYVFGRGWTVGPDVSLMRAGLPSEWFLRNEVVVYGGLAASGDVVITPGGDLSYRVHVGPELGALHPCPSLVPSLSGGAVWAFHRGARPRLGLAAEFSFLGAVTNPFDRTPHPTSNPLFVGLGYRYAALLDHEHDHELDFETRTWFIPFESGAQLAVCGTLSPGTPRVPD